MNKNVFYILMGIFIIVMIWYVSKQPKATNAEKGIAPGATQPGQSKPQIVQTQQPTPQTGSYVLPVSYTPPQTPQSAAVNENLQLNIGVNDKATVKAAQTLLNSLGYTDSNGNTLTVDGVYGAKSKSAHDKALNANSVSDRSLKTLKNIGNIGTVFAAYNVANAAINPVQALFNYFWGSLSNG